MRELVDVAVVQFSPEPLARSANVEAMSSLISQETAREHTDLVIFPELSTTGYVPTDYSPDFHSALRTNSEEVPGPTTSALGRLAARCGTTVVVGLSERGPRGELYSSAVLISSDGEVVGVHRKVHLWCAEKSYFRAGDRFDVFSTELGVMGMSICYDSRFPESSRVQALAGADILVCIFALAGEPGQPEELGRQSIAFRSATRAMENSAYFLAANRKGTAPDGDFFGGSVVASPSGELLGGGGGKRGDGAGLIVRSRLSAAALKAARRYADVNSDRRPEVYQRLLGQPTGEGPADGVAVVKSRGAALDPRSSML